MEFLYLLEKIRIPILNDFMSLITHLGEETAFLVVALVIFWCVDKYKGYYTLGVGLLGTLANQFLKIACRVPRPWVRDPNFTIVETARAEAGGYSFPSGHTQSAFSTFGCIAVFAKRKWVKALCVVIAILVGFSRMYLGVHFPSDVLVGAGMACALVVLARPLMEERGRKYIPWFFGALLVCSGAFLVYVERYPFPEDVDITNYASAVKNAYTLMGCAAGILAASFLDEKKFHFQTEAIWWAQILKVILGLAAVLVVKEGFRAPLDDLFRGHLMARAVRYFFVVMMAGVVWPMTFPWFAKLGKEQQK